MGRMKEKYDANASAPIFSEHEHEHEHVSYDAIPPIPLGGSCERGSIVTAFSRRRVAFGAFPRRNVCQGDCWRVKFDADELAVR